ncbi:hypothetical protein HYPSUDRAFT_220615 [Hypholoma sublateritium FD-334 SS-4]|uniref:Uncharacterized protein n=1 Tax=Hypholoma sublateritium (strain FD-334 SS-4) TaxID=945553 RepID=A0A0D2N4Q0_HYPSF|nr:hypothetical protein HYPSUDRAFT_220615 [Hypholoma sublateritium FD-334 SS-4]
MQYERFKATWESFIDNVMREWKTFNILSVLLLSAILTILQIPGAADDPVTRYSALLSLICALLSLLFGCMYIIRFGSMRKTYKAAEWALEAKRTKTAILWNVWVLLAMPAFWLTWSIVLYIVCIMSFIWRTNAQSTQLAPPLSNTHLLIIRISISSVLGLGMLYGALVLRTFSRYGETMDRAWKRRLNEWVQEKMLPHDIATSYCAQSYETHPVPSGQYPHLPEPSEPYIQSLLPGAGNASEPLSIFPAAPLNTPHDQKPSAENVRKFNPPGYMPSSVSGALSVERKVADNDPIHGPGFHVPSPPEIPAAAESTSPFTGIISRDDTLAIDEGSPESECNSLSSGLDRPPSLVDGDIVETSGNRVRERSPVLSATSSNCRGGDCDLDVRPVSPVVSLGCASTSSSVQSVHHEINNSSGPSTGEQDVIAQSQSNLHSDPLDLT